MARQFLSGAAFMSLPVYVSRNGVLIAPAHACVPVFSPAIYGAYGIYESMQVTRGVVFALQIHLRRLIRSAALLQLPLPADIATLERWIADVLAANDASECVLRLFVVGPDDGEEAVTYIWPQPAITFPAKLYRMGATAITFEGRRFWPEAKSLNTLVSYLARRQAQSVGSQEGLLYHDGYLTEGANSNLFAVLDSAVLTPPVHQVLSGVTRDIVMGLSAQHGIELHEAPLALASLPGWSECFITSTSRHVMPITVIDDRPVGNGQVGPLTARLMALFEECFSGATSGACLDGVR
jgi:branched-subunit amino acid aminotransferase/4-amino-4-deoxychorismate lyase